VQSDGSRLKLHLRENYTSELLAALREGALDSIILSPPFDMEGMHVVPLYDEAFVVAMPRTHPWTKLNAIPPASLANENVLLLTAGNCFRDQVLDECPELRLRDAQSQSFRIHEGSSLSTIRQMVASGAGVTILPLTSVAPAEPTHSMLEFRPFAGVTPTRQIVLASRRNFPRRAALTELIDCLRRCELPNVTWRLQSSRSQAADVDQDPAAQRG
jgi:LysR family hydrogen peroxide-inducible transcriptional activator